MGFISFPLTISLQPQPGPSGIQRPVLVIPHNATKAGSEDSSDDDEIPTNVYVSNASRPQTVIQATFSNQQYHSIDWLLDNDSSDDNSSSSVEYVPPSQPPVRHDQNEIRIESAKWESYNN